MFLKCHWDHLHQKWIWRQKLTRRCMWGGGGRNPGWWRKKRMAALQRVTRLLKAGNKMSLWMCFCELSTLFSAPMLLRPMIYMELCICTAGEERGDGSAWEDGSSQGSSCRRHLQSLPWVCFLQLFGRVTDWSVWELSVNLILFRVATDCSSYFLSSKNLFRQKIAL